LKVARRERRISGRTPKSRLAPTATSSICGSIATRRSPTPLVAALHIATSRDPDAHRATIEMSTAAPEIVSALAAGAHLPLGLFRMDGKAPRRYLEFRPAHTPSPNFHVPRPSGS